MIRIYEDLIFTPLDFKIRKRNFAIAILCSLSNRESVNSIILQPILADRSLTFIIIVKCLQWIKRSFTLSTDLTVGDCCDAWEPHLPPFRSYYSLLILRKRTHCAQAPLNLNTMLIETLLQSQSYSLNHYIHMSTPNTIFCKAFFGTLKTCLRSSLLDEHRDIHHCAHQKVSDPQSLTMLVCSGILLDIKGHNQIDCTLARPSPHDDAFHYLTSKSFTKTILSQDTSFYIRQSSPDRIKMSLSARYSRRDLLGRGAFGEVYIAERIVDQKVCSSYMLFWLSS